MTMIHLHLAICHVPVVGLFFACAALLIAVFRSDVAFHRWALVFTVFAGLSALPATWSGERAEDALGKVSSVSPVVSMDAVEEHEEAAETALAFALAAAGTAALGFVVTYYRPGAARAATALALLASVAGAGCMGYAANLGGAIRHAEIRAENPATR